MMLITLKLSTEMEARLRESVARGDVASVRQVLHDAAEPTVAALLHGHEKRLSDEEFERLADQLADEVAALVGTDRPPLTDYAVSREGIYEDHP